MPFRNNIVAGTALVREAINSEDFQTGVSGWSINKDGSAEFNDLQVRGSFIATGNAQSANYVAGASGWQLRSDGTAEFNGNVGMESAIVTGAIQSTNFVAGSSGWRLREDGTAEFNGSIVTGLTDGRVHIGSAVATSVTVLNNQVAVASANAQNTPQVAGHAYRGTLQISVSGAAIQNRGRFRLWDGAIGGTQLGLHAPIFKVVAATGVYEAQVFQFIWAAPTTRIISNINVGLEFFSGTAGTGVSANVDASSFLLTIEDLGRAGRITNL